jgi:hypothetical protein
VALTALATMATTAVLAPSAMAVSSVTIKTAFENSPISIGPSDAVGYAFTNATGSSETVTFTDTLPAGVTLDSPVGQTLTNGTSSGCVVGSTTAAPGASSLTVTITIPGASGTVCTLSYSVVAGTPSNDLAISDVYSGVTASSGGVSTTPGSLKVLSSPSLSFTAPTSNQSFYLGQVSTASFACAATDPLDSIDSFFGTDDEGNQVQSGAPIDTVDPGAHTLTVDCYSAAGGGSVEQAVNYTVGSYSLSAVKAAKTTDVVSFRTTVPAGKLNAKVFYGKKVIGTTNVAPASRGSASVVVKPTSAGKKLLAGLKGKSASLKLQTSFTPAAVGTGALAITPSSATVLTKTVKLSLVHAKKAKAAKTAHTTSK